MISASGYSALVLRAAMRASSASTTTWFTLPFSLRPTANFIGAPPIGAVETKGDPPAPRPDPSITTARVLGWREIKPANGEGRPTPRPPQESWGAREHSGACAQRREPRW